MATALSLLSLLSRLKGPMIIKSDLLGALTGTSLLFLRYGEEVLVQSWFTFTY